MLAVQYGFVNSILIEFLKACMFVEAKWYSDAFGSRATALSICVNMSNLQTHGYI